jgi:23S rRNA-/tRNA-specific pseudouridylate synthase
MTTSLNEESKFPLYETLVNEVEQDETEDIIHVDKWALLINKLSNLPDGKHHHTVILLLIIKHYKEMNSNTKLTVAPYKPKIYRIQKIKEVNLSYVIYNLPPDLIKIISKYLISIFKT